MESQPLSLECQEAEGGKQAERDQYYHREAKCTKSAQLHFTRPANQHSGVLDKRKLR